MNPFRPISISLSPNTEKDDVLLALKLIFQPWKWKVDKNYAIAQNSPHLLEEEFKSYLGVRHAISFNSGRSAFLAILNSLGLNKDDAILIQAFTCNAVVNPILWNNLKPVYVDCDEKTFNIDIEDLERTLRQGLSAELSRSPQGKKPKVLMVQHTFGLPAEMDEISEICRRSNLILIEDCAHSLGAEYSPPHQNFGVGARGRKVGTFGKVSFFSFSRDKVISSVYGGLVATNEEGLAGRIRQYQEEIGYPSNFWIFQQLLHPILMNWLILPTYRILGKYLLILFQWLSILSKAIHRKEKRGEKPGYFPKRSPNALSCLALNQFRKLERFNLHRQELADFYFENLKNTNFQLPPQLEDREQVFLRFTITHPKAHQIIKKAWQKNILIGDWYDSPVAPHDTKLDKMKYEKGLCPKAEKLSKVTLNLPTHINISEKEAQKIIDFLKQFSK